METLEGAQGEPVPCERFGEPGREGPDAGELLARPRCGVIPALALDVAENVGAQDV